MRDLCIVGGSFWIHASVYASQGSLWSQINSAGTLMDLAINLMSAVCASMTNTAFRLKNESVVVTQVMKELAYGVAVGVTAGVVTYAVAEAAQTNKFLQLALVTLSGWGGARAIEYYSDKYFGGKHDRTKNG